jgi:hypothetical protein
MDVHGTVWARGLAGNRAGPMVHGNAVYRGQGEEESRSGEAEKMGEPK